MSAEKTHRFGRAALLSAAVAIGSALPGSAAAPDAYTRMAIAVAQPEPFGGGDRMIGRASADDDPAQLHAPIGNPLWAIPLSSLREERDRPIFLPARRRPPPAVAAAPAKLAPPPPPPPAPAAKTPPPLALVGAIISDPDRIAVFRDETTREFIRMRVGEGHSGWVLRELSRSEAVFANQSDTAVIAMPRPEGK